ncbi:hypothetical protein N7499_003089 [Penicillium canescens]|uniref:Uncharacterized protein n=1 Tax=Penicillium canescens TaxID=5083 RepID=A0AAD6IBL2_PENCN|nr:uncharacterized protein N7446_011961 [Penicillium canescens]KAJ6019811.1 hypothetical protein N7522_000519 [Penicillium canescens]KAJ6039104.1 hypothetical protein N7460_007136 [Penicillium canescens]KAJ6047127.1 hypothetical protein N7446_011961 [Penicillium canescens]KAJ6059879.1 hypothetical protein N7444_003518 [Penicillium canescens]KAJ6093758.1 hypothetical protein N7499_003089 [Penicillium canescens]
MAAAAPSSLRSCAVLCLSSVTIKPTANPKAAKFEIFLDYTLMQTKGTLVNAQYALALLPAAPNFQNLENDRDEEVTSVFCV